jgi:hypothetical protein
VEQHLHKEIARLVDIGVLEEDFTLEWASPTFGIVKKNGTIRVVLASESATTYLNVTHFQYQKLGT